MAVGATENAIGRPTSAPPLTRRRASLTVAALASARATASRAVSAVPSTLTSRDARSAGSRAVRVAEAVTTLSRVVCAASSVMTNIALRDVERDYAKARSRVRRALRTRCRREPRMHGRLDAAGGSSFERLLSRALACAAVTPWRSSSIPARRTCASKRRAISSWTSCARRPRPEPRGGALRPVSCDRRSPPFAC